MSIELYKGDLPDNLEFGNAIAIDTETTGLSGLRDRLCLVQISSGDGNAHLVQIPQHAEENTAPKLKALLANPDIVKIFHFARFDLMMLKKTFLLDIENVYCTRTASRLARTYTDRHGLRDVCKELLGVDLNKQYQTSDWAAQELNKDQMNYAANDVLYLHALREKLEEMLQREGRSELAKKCFDFIQTRADLDLRGWADLDIFAH